MTRRGLLLTMTEPPAAMEEEFNAWYDTEHLAQRLADCRPGEGKYLATYELDSPGVLQAVEYLARFEDATPCTRVDPWSAEAQRLAKALLLIAHDAPFELASTPSALQVRRFALVEFAWPEPARLPSAPAGALTRLYRAYGT
jgi:hypothetical protein